LTRLTGSRQEGGALAALAVSLCLIAGCQSASVEDLAPSAALVEPPAIGVPVPSSPPVFAAAAQAEPSPARPPFEPPKNTGEYPKIGYIPVGETSQLGPDGTAALRGQLASSRAAQSANADAPESYAAKLLRLRRLMATHIKATLDEIEAR
jgi:hypothetical protein